MRRLTAAIVILLTAMPLIAYEPLTRDQAYTWLQSITLDTMIDFVIRYDYVEHAVPEIEPPTLMAAVTGQDLTVFTETPGTIEIGHLKYEFSTSSISYTGLIPKADCYTIPVAIGVGVGGLLAGFLLGRIIQ